MTGTDGIPAIAIVPPTADQIAQYPAVSGDPNPIHANPDIAAAIGLPDTPVPGLLTMAMTETAVRQWFPEEEVTEVSLTFSAPVFPGDVLTAHGRIAARAETETGEEITVRIRLAHGDGRIAAIGALVVTRAPRT